MLGGEVLHILYYPHSVPQSDRSARRPTSSGAEVCFHRGAPPALKCQRSYGARVENDPLHFVLRSYWCVSLHFGYLNISKVGRV